MGKSKVVDAQRDRLKELLAWAYEASSVAWGRKGWTSLFNIEDSICFTHGKARTTRYRKSPLTIVYKEREMKITPFVLLQVSEGLQVTIFSDQVFKPGSWYFHLVEALEKLVDYQPVIAEAQRRLVKIKTAEELCAIRDFDFSSWEA